MKTITPGSVYDNYNEIVKKIETYIQIKKIELVDFKQEEINERLIQRIVELTCDLCTKEIIKKNTNSKQNFKGININLKTGKIKLSSGVILINLSWFAISWTKTMLILLASLFCKSLTKSLPATLVMEVGGDYEVSDKKLVEFLNDGSLTPLKNATFVLIKSNIRPKEITSSKFEYVADPLLNLIKQRLSLLDKVMLIYIHLKAPILLLKTLYSFPLMALIARDFNNLTLVKRLDQKNLIESIILTNSSFTTQPLWIRGKKRNFDTHMIWYSQNFIPKIYKGETKRCDLPTSLYMKVDVHWVWTEGFKKYLRSIGQKTKINVVGPLVWYLPEKKKLLKQQKFKILLFDITPWQDSHKPSVGAIHNYYTLELIKKFVLDVISICSKLEKDFDIDIFIDIKHKRAINLKLHDNYYIKFLDDLEVKYEKFKIENYKVNLFHLLSNCNLSISVPYTSTAYISAHLKKAAVYYDPFGKLIPSYEKSRFIKFVSNKRALKKEIIKSLNLA